jgi:hypothetical protein
MKARFGSLLPFIFLVGSLALSGCNQEKARVLKGAAVEFRNESLAAIDAIDTMHRRELEAPPRSPADVRRSFVSQILQSKSPIDAALIDLAIDPFQPPSDPEWESFVTDLRSQYEDFAQIFTQLEAGGLVAADDVRRSAEYAQKLTVQMTLFADAISRNPPVLHRYRNAVILDLRKQRQAYQKIQAKLKENPDANNAPQLTEQRNQIETRVGELMDQWQQVKAEEQKLLQSTLEQCLKAAVLGKELGQLVSRYDDLSLDQISLAIPRILDVASAIDGKDFTTLQLRAATLSTQIQQDPLWNQVATASISRINRAVDQRTQTAQQ